MKLKFEKYHGTGNDFVILDGRNQLFRLEGSQISELCNRNFGIGADGLIIVREKPHMGFEMEYYNADGKLASMCGNGGRCFAAWLFRHGITPATFQFNAPDGLHSAAVIGITGNIFQVELGMSDVIGFSQIGETYHLNTGSPHLVVFVEDLKNFDVVGEGRRLRYDERFAPGGTNVNFIKISDNDVFVRTYERGVENETLSCGTGVTASAIAAFLRASSNKTSWQLITRGGILRVSFEVVNQQHFGKVVLSGAAAFVFKGEIEIA